MRSSVLPIPKQLQAYVECIRTMTYEGAENLAINVCLNGLPGIVFQHHDGQSPIDNITTRSGFATNVPTLYVYGQMTRPGVMNHKPMPFRTIQVILKPHALQTLLGVNASVLTNTVVDLAEFSSGDLNTRLFDVGQSMDGATLIIDYLSKKLQQVEATGRLSDGLIEESLRLIHCNAANMTVKTLLDTLNISERQFEKRFRQAVGIPPHFYIRVRRFNEAIRLMKAGRFDTLTAVAHHLNFYDQSHFIRDIRAFSGITPKSLSQKVDDIELDQRVMAYIQPQ
jgi:AraC-like DNA-binding protein